MLDIKDKNVQFEEGHEKQTARLPVHVVMYLVLVI